MTRRSKRKTLHAILVALSAHAERRGLLEPRAWSAELSSEHDRVARESRWRDATNAMLRVYARAWSIPIPVNATREELIALLEREGITPRGQQLQYPLVGEALGAEP